jgi:S-layer protein
VLDENFAVAQSTDPITIQDAPNSGQAFTLTTSVDEFVGGAGNDTFKATIDGTTAANNTLTALDALDGGDGTDILKINNTSAALNDATDLSVATISNIETINIQAVGGITDTDNTYTVGTNEVDFSSISGLETINVTKSTAALLKAADTTDVNVSGATGDISVQGGNNVTVSDATADTAITVGNGAAGGDAAGAITITDTDNAGTVGTDDITVEGGTDVTVTTTADATSADIIVGDATNGEPTGAVNVTQNTTSDASGGVTVGDATVTGGTTIDITANITTTADDGANTVATAGIYTATAGDSTTDVTITQNVTATDYDSEVTTAGTYETATVTFGALAKGEAVVIADAGAAATVGTDLTFTASKALTAEEVAAAFANLTDGDKQAAGGVVANGIFTGALDAGWASGAASGSKVTFTATSEGNIANNLDVATDADAAAAAADNDATNDADFSVSVTEGVDEVKTTAQDITGDYGNVVIDDNATASITTVTLNGFDGATIGNATALSALESVSLTNSAGAIVVDNGATATTLDATVDGITGSMDIDNGAASVTTLDITTANNDSAFTLTGTAVTDLAVSGDSDLDLTGSTLSALETVTVTGSTGVTAGDLSAVASLTSIDASGTSGDNSATIDASNATYTGGTGADALTLGADTVSKAIDLGAGDDTLTLNAATTTVPTATVAGGDGTDTVSMDSTSADSFDANTNFATAISGFEQLLISDKVDVDTADVTIDVEALGFSYVGTSGIDDTDDNDAVDYGLILDNMASAGTVVLTDTQNDSGFGTTGITVNVKDASTGAADSLNIVVETQDDSTADQVTQLDAGTITADDVESFTIQSITDDEDGGDNVLVANGDSATSITVTGDSDLDLTTNSTVLADLDASALTGDLTYTTVADTAITVTGGSGDDALTASGSQDTLLGGAGDDTLTGNDLTTLTGGDGADTFVMNTPSNVNSYSTITDLETGDIVQFTAASKFVSSAIELGDTAVFQDYANATVKALDDNGNDVAWFEFNGNTYIIESGDDATDDFVAGTDSIIKIAGVVDLSTASYNQTDGTLEVA